MKTALATLFSALAFFALAFFTISSKSDMPEKPVVKNDLVVRAKSVPTKNHQSVLDRKKTLSTGSATVSARDFEITVYGAFAFAPDDSFAQFMKTDSGHQFVVLDMAMQNTPKNKMIDIGRVLLSATVTDEDGNIYPRNALALEAFEMQYPEQGHRAEYRAMRGKIKPGSYYRTTAFGFEAPETQKTFSIAFPLGEKSQKGAATNNIFFSIE